MKVLDTLHLVKTHWQGQTWIGVGALRQGGQLGECYNLMGNI